MPKRQREKMAISLPPSRARTRFCLALVALLLVTALPFTSITFFCESFVPPSSSITSSIGISKSPSPLLSRSQTSLNIGRNTESERLKRKREDLEAKVLRQELLSEIRDKERAKSRIDREIRDAEQRRRNLNEQASIGRNYISDLQSGSFGAVNSAKKFLDNGKRRPSRLDIERERLERELDQLRKRQKTEAATQALTTYGGIAAAVGLAANVLNGNGELGDLGTASGLRKAFPSTSKYLTDLSAKQPDKKPVVKYKSADASGKVAMPYLDAKIEQLEKKVKTERENVKQEARELERLAREKEEARKKGLLEAEKKAEKEAKEKAEKEAKLKAEKEAKEKAERDAKLKAEKEAKEKAEKEAKEKAEKEAKEKAEKEAKIKAEMQAKDKIEKEAKDKAQMQAKENEAKIKAQNEAKEKSEKVTKEKAAVAVAVNNDKNSKAVGGFVKQVQQKGFVNAVRNLDTTAQVTAAVGIIGTGVTATAAAYYQFFKNDDDNFGNSGFGIGGQNNRNRNGMSNNFSNRQGGTPSFGNQGGTPSFGNSNQGGTPSFGNQGGTPSFGKSNQGGTPSFGNQGGTPSFGTSNQGGTPAFGNHNPGNQGFRPLDPSR